MDVQRDVDGDIAGDVAEDKSRWQQLQADHAWIRNLVTAWALMTRNNGNQYAAAITYFSFLALFPLLLLAVSVTGFVLSSAPGVEADLFNKITQEVPGDFGNTLSEAVQTAIDKRAGVGLVGLVGVLLTGLGWIGNLREAIDAVWGAVRPKVNFVMQCVANLGVLAGLGAGLVVSLVLTVVGTSLTTQILDLVGLDDIPGSTVVLKILGIAIAVAADSIIFWWVLVHLPDVEVDRHVAIKGSLAASAGFEVLKILGTYTIAHSASSPTAGPFASILAVLVWIQLVSRLMLFTCAWMATVNTANRKANTVPVSPVTDASEEPAPETRSGPSPAAVGATLVGAGAVAGAVATWAATAKTTAKPGKGRRGRD